MSIIGQGAGNYLGQAGIFPNPQAGQEAQAMATYMSALEQSKASQHGADVGAAAERYASDAQKAAALAAIQGQNARQQQLLDWQRSKFNTMLPYLNQGMGQVGGAGSGMQYGVSMPTMPTAPSFDPGAFLTALRGPGGNYGFNIPTHPPVLSDAQVQQQVNSAVARNQQNTASNVRTAQQQLGGRGFSSASPILASIQAQLQGAGMAANANADLQARMNAAQLNAEQAQKYYGADIQSQTALANAAQQAAASMYGSQVAAGAGVYGSQMDAYNKAIAARVQEEQIRQQGQNAILAALSNMVGSGLG